MDYLAEGVVKALYLLLHGNAETYSAMGATVSASTLSILASLILGAPLGFLLGHYDFPGRRAVRSFTDTMLCVPTVVIGLLVYAFLTRHGPLGSLGLLFTIPGIALGQTVLGLPIVVAMTATAVEGLDERLSHTLMTLGANRKQIFLTTLSEARFAIALAAVAAYGRIVSEIGISMMIGGNIKWHTRTITTAIALETGKGEFAMGIALGLVLLVVAFGVNLLTSMLRRRAGK
ncbi:MAG: ABC transporter permease [Proteobacteria bacterium]|nr:ABC transporter permease [Pseudomonadota bacterium]MBU1612243.1 ABC transporter permease [Pseudomonadota bacterium]